MSGPTIRTARPEDAADLAAIYAFEDVVAYTTQLPHRDTRFWQDFYKTRDPENVELVAVLEGRVVGHLGMLLNRAPRRKHVGTFGLCVHPDVHGRGIGSALMTEMLNMADNWLNLLRLELGVASDNARAIALYERFGFTRERESRFDLFTRGRFASTTHMARFHPAGAQMLQLA
ncbi:MULTISPECIES: GNAT family N-acetyltransferase [Ancylobacter]|uniref:Acetyltransferase n=2 Tax=Ancylobacter TaxID=99 RepID=A0ABU0LW12_9HYPH|nr:MULTISPECIES: GNAT family N-acetyltransferase [Ancylobacter]MBB3773578.1 putative acetyltransferase [Ancylobacter tetraedralis]MDQ0512881.1 putative acetyltransferase [Ancylobacter amanitiformis]